MGFWDTLQEKASEVLGEDTVESLWSLRDDAASAVRQVGAIASEVSEDCDNDVTRGAREFYSGVARGVQNGVRKSAETARVRAEERKTARERERIRKEKERQRRKAARRVLMKKAAIVLVGLIVAATLILTAAFRLGHRTAPKEQASASAAVTAVQPDGQDEQPGQSDTSAEQSTDTAEVP